MRELNRCGWASIQGNELYARYHDREWGVPVHSDRLLFEFLVLEGAQAGLSWLTILNRREGYRKAFDGFNSSKVAAYDRKRIDALLKDPGIIRNRLKIESAVNNAKAFLAVQKEFGSFDRYIWGFVPNGRPRKNRWKRMSEIPASTDESDRLSADLRRRGFTFVGTTICYAHMQATGMVNDHLVSCFRYNQV